MNEDYKEPSLWRGKLNIPKKKKVAWGITGCGDRLPEIVNLMKKIRKRYKKKVGINIFLSKAGSQVLKYYNLIEDLKANFRTVKGEINSNIPFLAGALQLGKYEFLLIAPATSNTVAKISLGIADTLLTNAVIMALKAFVPVYILPSDYKEGSIITKLPDGHALKLRVRKEDVENVIKLANMEDVFILENIKDIYKVFKKHFSKN